MKTVWEMRTDQKHLAGKFEGRKLSNGCKNNNENIL